MNAETICAGYSMLTVIGLLGIGFLAGYLSRGWRHKCPKPPPPEDDPAVRMFIKSSVEDL